MCKCTPQVRIIETELASEVRDPRTPVGSPGRAGEFLRRLIGRRDREHFVALHLNAKHEIISAETISIGTLDSAPVHAREVFKAAILANAYAIICGHNHPSGHVNPSREDRELQARLHRAGALLGIPLLDFFVVTRDDHLTVSC